MFGIMSGIVFLMAQAASNPYHITLQHDQSNTQPIVVPLSGIHIRVSSQDVRGNLSCALTAVNGRLYAGQIGKTNNSCDFTYKPIGGMVCNDKGYACPATMLLHIQNDDDFVHQYVVSFTKE